MQIQPNSKVIMITGCSSGIGKHAAEYLSTRGYRVIATVRNMSDADKLRLKAEDMVIELDLASEGSVSAAVDQVLEFADGELYALFNNAAYGQPGAVEDLSRAALRRQFETNVFGTHQLTRLLIPSLLTQERAHIVQCSSVLGFVGMPMRGAYCASKFALEGLSDTLRMELSDTAIQVSLIEPGPIVSYFRQNALKALVDHVDFSQSRHGWRYEAAVKRLEQEGAPSKYTLQPSAVTAKLIHALEAKRAKKRYYVTRVTHVVAWLKRISPEYLLDKILLKYAKEE